jgi:hypothetical protein
VRLNSSLRINQGPILSTQPSHCFTITLCLGSQRIKTLVLLDSRASVKKLSHVHVEVIDEQPLSSGDVIYKTTPLEVRFGKHSSSIVFNIIRTPSAPAIFGLFWLERYNLQTDITLVNIIQFK